MKVLANIAVQPYMFKSSGSKAVRKGFISSQTFVFYEIIAKEIHILWFWDNRQDSFFENLL